MDEKLKKLIDEARGRPVSDEERYEQRIGFAFGNAPKNDRNTKESIREIDKAGKALDSK